MSPHKKNRHPKICINRSPDLILGCFLYRPTETKSVTRSTEPYNFQKTIMLFQNYLKLLELPGRRQGEAL